ncbi:MAG: leucine-rich repeat domain-containing protein [Saprospiraceae bacterium]|nr:leucine-rich repeat domain-containing protein [Saprospiraceae bacterium]
MKCYDLATALKFPDQVEHLVLYQQGYSRVPDVTRSFPRLRHLALENNRLSEFPDILNQLPALESLDLSGNQLQHLPHTFSLPPGLKQLNLKNNQIQELPAAFFTGTHLEKIILSGNPIGTGWQHLGQLNYLVSLEATDCGLSKVPTAWLSWKKIRHLDLSGNTISTIPFGLENWLQLETLNLERNRISRLPNAFFLLKNLRQLNLRKNRLHVFSLKRADWKKLQKIDLGHNKITAFPDGLPALSLLRELDLSANKLDQVPAEAGSCGMLRQLNVSQNNIHFIAPEFWSQNTLHTIDLRRNKLERLDAPKSFSGSLRNLFLDGNPLRTIAPELGHCQDLRKLHLRGNHLAEIPECLWSLTRLEEFKGITGSRQLLRFLAASAKADTPLQLRPPLFDFYTGKNPVHLSWNPELMLAGLRLGLPALEATLWEWYEQLFDPPSLKNGDSVVACGKIPFQTAALEKAGLKLLSGSDLNARFHIVTKHSSLEDMGKHPFISIRKLRDFLRSKLQQDTGRKGPILLLLEKPAEVNLRLAVSLIGQQRLSTELLSVLFVRWAQAQPGSVKDQLRKILQRQLDPALLQEGEITSISQLKAHDPDSVLDHTIVFSRLFSSKT